MRDGIGEWLVSGFSLFGVQLQNWMLVVAALIAITVIATIRKL
jgi:hypothetical protein